MKNPFLLILFAFFVLTTNGQIGIGTASPNSTLDIRGSLSNALTTFTTNTTAGITHNMMVFTGTSATTLTLPTAIGITGREYWVKNASSNSSVLTIATTSSQTVDGLSSWTLTQTNKAIRLVSDGTNWYAAAESLPGSTGTPWVLGGNNVTSLQNIGTTSNYALPFITNNTEKMRLSATGNLGIGTSSFNATNPEKLLVDAGTTTSYNVISGKGSIDNYLQLNIQNNSAGNSASSDVVATANNGSETVNFIDMGINSSSYNAAAFNITGINDAYLYSTGNDLAIGNATANRAIKFFTAGTLAANERMRINHLGNVAIGTSTWDGSNPEKLLIDAGTTSSIYPLSMKGTMNGWFQTKMTNSSTGTGASADFLAANSSGAFVNMGMNGTGYTGSGILGGASKAYLWTSGGNDFVIGNASASKYMAFFTGGQSTTNERIRIDPNGYVGIGTSTFNGTYPEKLIVDAGATGNTNYQNVIVGKGNTNSYAQLNIQNINNGNGASSDVVATADNGSETTNYVDMGINSSTNSSGIMGGANDSYLYNVGQNFLIGTGTASKSLVFMTGGTTQSTNERMRIDGSGNVGVGTNNPGNKLEVNSGTGGVSGLRLKQLPSGAVLFMNSTADVTQNNSNFYFDGTNYRLGIAAGASPHSTLQVGGSVSMAITTKTANYTASVSDYTILCNNSGAITISLPAASGCSGRIYVIKKISGILNNVTIDPNASETIDGSTTRTMTLQNDSVMIQSDGANWYVL